MNNQKKTKPGPKPEPYPIEDARIRKIPGASSITTAKQYQKLVSYLEIPLADRDPCVRLGATVPPSPQMARNASVRLKIARIFKEHQVKDSMHYKPPRCFIFTINNKRITEALLEDLRSIEGVSLVIDEEGNAFTIWVDPVDDNVRESSQSIWAVTYPSGKVEIIKRLQDPRAAHRWMTNEQRPWNNKVAPENLALADI